MHCRQMMGFGFLRREGDDTRGAVVLQFVDVHYRLQLVVIIQTIIHTALGDIC